MTDDSNVSHLPEPGVILDLDLESRPEKDNKAPFVVKIGGKSVTFADPTELPWQELASVEQPVDLIRAALNREDRNHVYETNLPAWKFNRLMEAYYTHYDLEEKIESAKRQAQFRG